MANITNFLNKIKTAVHGKDVRGAIHDAIKQVYDDASVEHDNANMEVKLARGTHNTLNNRLDNVDEIQAQTNAQLLKEITFGYDNTLYVSLKERSESLYANVKDFGAKGDGVANDSDSFKNAIFYCQQENKDLFIPKGDYYLTETLMIDIEKMGVFGVESETTLWIDDNFSGDTLLYIYSGDGTWENRRKRIRTVKNLKLKNFSNQRKVIGLRTSGETGTEFEGHVERMTYKNLMIEGFESAILYGSHVYACIFEKIYTKDCAYAIKSEDKQIDAGEIPVFRNCFFADAGHRIDVKCDLMFLNCTFHSMGEEYGDTPGINVGGCHLTFNQCHFECIRRTPMTGYFSPLMKLLDYTSYVCFNQCHFIVSGGNTIQFKSCVFDLTNGGAINMSDCDTEWYFKRIYFDDEVLASNGEVGSIFKTNGIGRVDYRGVYKHNLAWDGGRVNLLDNGDTGIINPLLSDTTPTNLFTTATDSGVIASPSDVVIRQEIVTDSSAINDKLYQIEFNNSHYDPKGFYVGVKLPVPQGKTAICLKARLKTSNSTNNIIRDNSYVFYDNVGNVIDRDYVNKVNGNFIFNIQIKTEEFVVIPNDARCIRKIPKGAKEVFVGIQILVPARGKTTMQFDYFIPFFI